MWTSLAYTLVQIVTTAAEDKEGEGTAGVGGGRWVGLGAVGNRTDPALI